MSETNVVYLEKDKKNNTNDTNSFKNKIKRPGRKIKIDRLSFSNKNVNGEIGTLDDKTCPQSVFITVDFWIDVKDNNKTREDNISNYNKDIFKTLEKELNKIYNKNLIPILKNNKYFPLCYENIYTYDVPTNLNCNYKKSFVSIELTLYTINCIDSKINLPLKSDNKEDLYSEIIKIYETMINSDLLLNKLEQFEVYYTKKEGKSK